MLTASLIHKYQIESTWNRVAAIDNLFRGTKTIYAFHTELMEFDPFDEAERDLAENWPDKKAEITVAIGPERTVIIQTIIFRTNVGYQRYLEDREKENIILFDEKEV